MNRTQLARSISIIAHPFAMSGAMVAGAAFRFEHPRDAWRTVGVVIALTLLPLAVLMIRQVRRGAWDNVDASNARERPILFATGMLGLVAMLAYALLVRPSSFLARGGICVLVMLAVCAVATRWIKVSLHMAFGALATTTLLLLQPMLGAILLMILPALAWSRLELARHTRAEVALGLIVGLACGLALTRL